MNKNKNDNSYSAFVDFLAASSRLIAMTLPVRGENLAIRLNIKG